MGLKMRLFLQFGIVKEFTFRKKKVCLYITQGLDVLIV
jgi:hypothetical protein